MRYSAAIVRRISERLRCLSWAEDRLAGGTQELHDFRGSASSDLAASQGLSSVRRNWRFGRWRESRRTALRGYLGGHRSTHKRLGNVPIRSHAEPGADWHVTPGPRESVLPPVEHHDRSGRWHRVGNFGEDDAVLCIRQQQLGSTDRRPGRQRHIHLPNHRIRWQHPRSVTARHLE